MLIRRRGHGGVGGGIKRIGVPPFAPPKTSSSQDGRRHRDEQPSWEPPPCAGLHGRFAAFFRFACCAHTCSSPPADGFLPSRLKLNRQAQIEGRALETINRRILVERVKVQSSVPGHISKPNLASNAVHLVMDACIPGGVAGVICHLPIVVAGRSNFDQELFIFG